jgi:hypothetical protein
MSSVIAQKADNFSVRTHLARKGMGVPASAEMTRIRHASRTRGCQAGPAARDRRYKKGVQNLDTCGKSQCSNAFSRG